MHLVQPRETQEVMEEYFCCEKGQTFNQGGRDPSSTHVICVLFLLLCVVYTRATKPSDSEQDTTFSPNQITFLAGSWPGDPEELAELLGVHLEQEEATDIDKCSSILQQWLDQSEGDRREKLVSKFEEEEYHGMAALIDELPN